MTPLSQLSLSVAGKRVIKENAPPEKLHFAVQTLFSRRRGITGFEKFYWKTF